MCTVLEHNGEQLTALLTGEIDHHTAGKIRDEIDAAIEFHHPACLVIDFGGVTFMDSSGIGLVMGRYKLMKQVSGRIRVENLSAGAYKVMKLAGIERLGEIKVRETVR